jgi:hypothetical protein
VQAAQGQHDTRSILLYVSSLGWGALICLCIWPPLEVLLPRKETDEGWKIVWRAEGSGDASAGEEQPTRIFAQADGDEAAVVVEVAGYELGRQQSAVQVGHCGGTGAEEPVGRLAFLL